MKLTSEEIQERKLAKQRANDRFRRDNDIRNKDPSKMQNWQLTIYKEIMKRQQENNALKAERESTNKKQGAPFQ